MEPQLDDVLLVERRDPVLLLTMNRPDKRNAIDQRLTEALLSAVELLGTDRQLTVGVLTGAGGAFCSGLDLGALKGSPPQGLRELLRHRSAKPLVAAVEGLALAGGFELALMCDLIVASRGAKLGLPEAKMGLMPTGGALFRLPERLALELALSGAMTTSDRAYEQGLIARLTEPGEALQVALDLAGAIGANAPMSVSYARQLITANRAHTEEQMWELMRPMRDQVFASQDATEGKAAFAEKRKPRWIGC